MKNHNDAKKLLYRCRYYEGQHTVVMHNVVPPGGSIQSRGPIQVAVDNIIIGEFKGFTKAKRAAILWIANGCKA